MGTVLALQSACQAASAYISFCICLPNFVQIRPSAKEWWRYVYFKIAHNFGILLPVSVFVISPTGKVQIYLHTICWRDISSHCWDITTSVFWKQTSAMLEFYFRFRFYVCVTIGMLFCICLPNFVKSYNPRQNYDVTSIFNMAAVSHSELSQVTAYHPPNANGLSGGSSIFDSIGFIVSEIMLFLCYDVLAWYCLFTLLYSSQMRRMNG